MSGWASLGEALMGGNRGNREMAYQRGALMGADMQHKLAVARQAVQEGIARESAAKRAFDAGDNDLGAAIMSGVDPRHFSGYRNDLAELSGRNGALDAARAGDDSLMNRFIAAGSMKPLEVAKIEGNTVLNPYAPIDSQSFAPTAIGKADIAHKMAQVGAENALAGERGAHAGLYRIQAEAGGFAPQSGNTAPATLMDAMAVDPNGLHGEEYLKTLDPAMRPIVQAVIDGRYPVPTGKAATAPEWLAVVRAATQADPSFDAGNYPARAAARKDLTGAGSGVKQIQSLNTLAGHLAELTNESNALENRSIPLWNRLANAVYSAVGDPRVPNFQRAADTVAGEFAYLLKGGVPSVTEIQEQRHLLDPSMSPQQLRDQQRLIASQVEARLQAVQDRANQGLGLGARDIQVISPESRAIFDRLSGHSQPEGQSAPQTRTINGKTYVNVNGQWYEQ